MIIFFKSFLIYSSIAKIEEIKVFSIANTKVEVDKNKIPTSTKVKKLVHFLILLNLVEFCKKKF